MSNREENWTKSELQAYVLLLCAYADGRADEGEIKVIKSKTHPETYEKMHTEFMDDTEEQRLRKIDDNVQMHYFTQMELAEFRREMYEVFFADCNFERMEKNMDRILDNILY